PAQDPDRLSGSDGQRDVTQRPEVLGALSPAPMDDALFDRVVLPMGQPETLRDVAHVDDEVTHAHSSSAKLPSSRPKTANATKNRHSARKTTARSRPTYQSMFFSGRTRNWTILPLTIP